MGRSRSKVVLFLCTGNYYRSRFAEALFDSVAGNLGLPWRAQSRGLALERGVANVGPVATAVLTALKERGVRPSADRFPCQVTADDLEKADLIVALKEAEHRPLLAERFPAWADRAEYWHVEDEEGVLPRVEREVMGLVARLLGGGGASVEVAEPEPPAPAKAARPAAVVRVGRETKGRRGKGVTTVFDLPLDEAELQELAAKLKQTCGTGGTVKDGRIELQGDQRDRLVKALEELGYKVKRAGG